MFKLIYKIKFYSQLETTPTLGSTETSTFEKERLARSSLSFNLKNKTFCELFPEICQEMQALLSHNQKENACNNNNTNDIKNGSINVQNNSSGTRGYGLENNQILDNNWQSIFTNLMVLFGFALFALIVNFVIKNINN